MKVTIVLLALLFLASCDRPPFCPEKVSLSVGQFSSMELGDRASIKKLSEAIRECPKASEYYISWTTIPNSQERPWRALVYTRKTSSTGLFGHEYDPGSGTGTLFMIDDESIQKVADAAGGTKELEKYQKGKMD